MADPDAPVPDRPPEDLTAFQRDLLVVLAGVGPCKGVTVQTELEESYDVAEVNHARLYTNLDALAEDGLVHKGSIDDRTNEYSLTDRGRGAVSAYLGWQQSYLGG